MEGVIYFSLMCCWPIMWCSLLCRVVHKSSGGQKVQSAYIARSHTDASILTSECCYHRGCSSHKTSNDCVETTKKVPLLCYAVLPGFPFSSGYQLVCWAHCIFLLKPPPTFTALILSIFIKTIWILKCGSPVKHTSPKIIPRKFHCSLCCIERVRLVEFMCTWILNFT